MRSATAFLPSSMMTLTNLVRSELLNFGSGRISRLGTSRRRGIDFLLSSVVAPVRLNDSGHRMQPHGAGLRLTRPPMCGRNLEFQLGQLAFGRLAPYFERDCLRSLTPWVSSEPRTMW